MVTCCFCGCNLKKDESIEISIMLDVDGESEYQVLYSHKLCFRTRLHKSITLHPLLLDEQ